MEIHLCLWRCGRRLRVQLSGWTLTWPWLGSWALQKENEYTIVSYYLLLRLFCWWIHDKSHRLYLRESASGTFFFKSLSLQTNYKNSKIRSEHPPNLLPHLFKLTENLSDTMYLQMLWPLPPWISSSCTVWSLASPSASWTPITAPWALDGPYPCLIKTPITTIEQNSVMDSDCYPRCPVYFCADWESDHGDSGWSLSWVSHKHIQHGRAAYWAGNLVSIDNLLFFTWKSTY